MSNDEVFSPFHLATSLGKLWETQTCPNLHSLLGLIDRFQRKSMAAMSAAYLVAGVAGRWMHEGSADCLEVPILQCLWLSCALHTRQWGVIWLTAGIWLVDTRACPHTSGPTRHISRGQCSPRSPCSFALDQSWSHETQCDATRRHCRSRYWQGEAYTLSSLSHKICTTDYLGLRQ